MALSGVRTAMDVVSSDANNDLTAEKASVTV